MIERSFFSTYIFELTFAFILLFAVNLIIIFLIRNSEIMAKKKHLKFFFLLFNTTLLSSLIISYYVLKPNKITMRIAFLPTEIKSKNISPLFKFALVEQIEHNLFNQSQDRFIIHSVWWMYQSLNHKYRSDISKYDDLYKKINTTYIVHSELTKSESHYQFLITVGPIREKYSFTSLRQFKNDSEHIVQKLLNLIDAKQNRPFRSYLNTDYVRAKQFYYQDKLDSLILWAATYPVRDSTILVNTIFARAFTKKGYSKSQYLNTENPYIDDYYKKPFIEAQKRLFYFYNKNQRNIDLYPALIQYFLYQSDYSEVDNLIKAYLTDFGKRNTIRKNNPGVLFDYSFLNTTRLKEDGFLNRNDVVKEVIEINPYSVVAHQRLVNLTLKTSSLFSDQVKQLFSQLRAFVDLNPYNDQSKFLLSDTYLKRGDIIRAQEILLSLYPTYKNESFINYNIGITYFRIGNDYATYKNYVDTNDVANANSATSKAIYYFERAIHIDKHLDAHLYLGVIYSKRKELDKAIRNLRYRVKYKLGPKDRFAKEAKKGLRKIFEDPNILKKYLKKEGHLREGF